MKKLLRRLGKQHSTIPKANPDKKDEGAVDSIPNPQDHIPDLSQLARGRARNGLRELQLSPLKKPEDEASYDVDLVAVHGLGGDSYSTWTHTGLAGEDDVFWLSHLLPSDVPGSRIFSFGYESEPTFSRSTASIRDSARGLLQHLMSVVNSQRPRPIIFLCHSLGGIIVKQAMVIAHEDDTFSSILEATGAIVFFGTPHRGSDIAAAAIPIAKFTNFWLSASGVSAFTGSMRTDLITVLKRDSQQLDDLNESFKQRARKIRIYSFYETEKPIGLQNLVVARTSATLGLSDEIVIPLAADHMSMCRFASPEDPNYRLVSYNISTAVQKLLINSSSRSFTNSEKKFIARFPSPAGLDIDDRVEGTCTWTLVTEDYLDWQNRRSPAILWITGEAGCGKTVIAHFLVEYLQGNNSYKSPNYDNDDLVCSFYCARDIQNRSDAVCFLRGLISQILTLKKEVIHHVRAKLSSTAIDTDPSFETLWRIFEVTIRLLRFKCLYIIIDGFDELDERSKKRLFTKFSQVFAAWSQYDIDSGKNYKLILCGQPHIAGIWNYSIPHLTQHRIKIEEAPQGFTADMLRYINFNINELVESSICTSSAADELRKILCNMAENSFLWVRIVLESIRNDIHYNGEDMYRRISEAPTNLKDAFTRYLPPVLSSSNIPRIRIYIQLLVACSRPLTLMEIDTFTSFAENPRPATTTNSEEAIVQRSIRQALGPLVKFPPGRAQFVHSTVKQYFTSLTTDPNHPLSSTHGTSLISAHLVLATSCIDYLLHHDFTIDLFNRSPETSVRSPDSLAPTFDSNIPEANDVAFADIFDIQDVAFLQDEEAQQEPICAEIRARYRAFHYASCHWAHHYAQSELQASPVLQRKAVTLISRESVAFSNWYKYMANQSHTRMPTFVQINALIVAALFDHSHSLRILLNDRETYSQQDCQMALYWSAFKGNLPATKELLNHGIRPENTKNHKTALSVAIQGGRTDVCAELLNLGEADPNFCSRTNMPPLLLACVDNHMDILRLLLTRSNILVTQRDEAARDCLMEACKSNALECVQELLHDGRVEVNSTDVYGCTSLIYASISGDPDLLRALLRTASLNTGLRDAKGRNAMSYAAERGDIDIIRLLWRAGVSVAAQDNTGRNAISWAANSRKAAEASGGKVSVLEYLLRKAPSSVDVPDEWGWAPLAWALERPGYLAAIRALLEIGKADVNQQDGTLGRSILAWASTEGFAEIIAYLLGRNDVEKNAMDRDGRTALSHAAGNGKLETVKILLDDEDVRYDIVDAKGRTAKDWAALNGHDHVMQFLEGT